MKTVEDKELNTQLQELYLTGKQWLSDVEFLHNEQRFLVSVADLRFADELKFTEEEQRQLYLNITGFMNQLEPLIAGATTDMDIRLIEDYCALQTKIAAALGHLKALKYRMINRNTIN